MRQINSYKTRSLKYHYRCEGAQKPIDFYSEHAIFAGLALILLNIKFLRDVLIGLTPRNYVRRLHH
jgi:hypothetical protein